LSSSTRLKSWTNQVVSGVQNHDNIDLLLTTTNDPAGQMDSSFYSGCASQNTRAVAFMIDRDVRFLD
jgi:hypothetical protein